MHAYPTIATRSLLLYFIGLAAPTQAPRADAESTMAKFAVFGTVL